MKTKGEDMKEQKHTQIPYQVYEDDEVIGIDKVNSNGIPVSLFSANNNIAVEINRANAAYIVKAVNNHDKLLEALTTCCNALEALGGKAGEYEVKKAKQVISETA